MQSIKEPCKIISCEQAVQRANESTVDMVCQQAKTEEISSKDDKVSHSTTTTTSSSDPLATPSKLIKDLNPFITCNLCKGYLIDATTIIECLHSFCRACIVKYLDLDNAQSRLCPKCNVQIHKTKPKQNIRSDPTLQDIVYKLVPKLYKDEMNRRKVFYSKHPDKAIGLSNEQKGEIHMERMILSTDDNIQLTIEYFPEVSYPFKLLPFKNDENQREQMLPGNITQRRYLLCKAGMKVLHLIKFIRYKYDLDAKIKVDFFYKQELLREDLTIMDLAYIYTWGRNMPIPLFYLIVEPNKETDDYLWLISQSKVGLSKPLRTPRKRRVLKNVLEPNNCNPQANARPASKPTNHLVSSNQRLFGNTSLPPTSVLGSSPSFCMLPSNAPSSSTTANLDKTELQRKNKPESNNLIKRKLVNDKPTQPNQSNGIKKAKVDSNSISTSSSNANGFSSSAPKVADIKDDTVTFTEDDSSTDISETSFPIDIICKSFSSTSHSDVSANSAGDAITNTSVLSSLMCNTDNSTKKQSNTGACTKPSIVESSISELGKDKSKVSTSDAGKTAPTVETTQIEKMAEEGKELPTMKELGKIRAISSSEGSRVPPKTDAIETTTMNTVVAASSGGNQAPESTANGTSETIVLPPPTVRDTSSASPGTTKPSAIETASTAKKEIISKGNGLTKPTTIGHGQGKGECIGKIPANQLYTNKSTPATIASTTNGSFHHPLSQLAQSNLFSLFPPKSNSPQSNSLSSSKVKSLNLK